STASSHSSSTHTSFFSYASFAPRDLPAFPTRRSSDLHLEDGWMRFQVPGVIRGDDRVDVLGHAHRSKVFPVALGIAPVGVAGDQIGRARLNSSHGSISYAVFCLKKKKRQ